MLIVFRPSPDLPPESMPPEMDGKWVDSDDIPIGKAERDSGSVAYARPTDRFETREDGERAQVFEVYVR